MKLAKQSVPYRAFQKVSGLVILLAFLGTAGSWSLVAAVGVAGAALVAAGAYEVAYWQRFDYDLTDDTLDIASGVISRREREIPYGRIQNVDVSRNVIQRVLGIAAVDLETAGGSSTEGSIRYVTPEEATRIQREVQRRKNAAKRDDEAARAGDADATGERRDALDEPTEEDLFSISPGELALVGALSFDGRLVGLLLFGVPVIAGGSYSILDTLVPGGSAGVLTAAALVGVGVLLFASWLLGVAVTFSNYYGFRLSRAGDELRYERGLFRRYSGSIPTEKVQSLTVTDNPAKRLLGYASLTIETAGYAPGQGGDYGSQAAVPLAKRERVLDLAREVEAFEDPTYTRPPGRIRWRYAFRYAMVVAAFVGVAFAVNWWLAGAYPWYATAGLLVAVPVAAHLKWKHRGYYVGEDHLLTRNGFWSRKTKVVPHYRIQNVIDSRTFFQRRWRVATVVADTAGTGSLMGSDAVAFDIETADAERLRADLTDRLQAALSDRRAERTGFEWYEADEETGERTGSVTVDGPAADEPAPDEPAVEGEPVTDTETADGKPAADDDESETSADAPSEGVVRPDFNTSDRDFSEPAETVDTGDYAVDQKPSDADVAFGVGRSNEASDEGDSADDESDAERSEESDSGERDPNENDPDAEDDARDTDR